MKNITPRIGIVASAGGLNTFATLGAINCIRDHNIKIDAAAGCSGGAFPLAAYCCGIDLRSLDPHKIAAEMEASFFDPDKGFWLKLLAKLIGYSIGIGSKNPIRGIKSMGYCKGDSLLRLLKDKFGDLTFQDTMIPFYTMSWNICEKREELFHKNGQNITIAEAIRMTSSIPLVFQPYEHRGNIYWDGGVINPMPVVPLLQNQPDINFLILIDTVGNDFVINPLTKSLSLLHALNDFVIDIQHTQLNDSIKYAIDKLGEENVVILTPPHKHGWGSFATIPEVISDGYKLMLNALKSNKKLQTAFEAYKDED